MSTTNPLAEKAVMASVKIRQWRGRRLDKTITDEVNQQHNASADAGRYNKLLLPKEAFAEIHSITSAARSTHYVLTLPWMDKGPRVLPSVLIDQFNTRFRQFQIDFWAAVDNFEAKYPAYLAAAPKRLNGMFKAEDYPDPKHVREEFKFKTYIAPCSNEEDFRVSIAKETLDDIKATARGDNQQLLIDAMKEPVERIVLVVGRMAERLKAFKPADEKAGTKAENTFRDSLVTNIKELVDLLPAFNLTGDAAFTKLIARMEKELVVADAEALREDTNLRKKVSKAADAILKQAEALMA